MRHCLALLMIAFAALSSTPADAEIFPDRPIHIVVPFPAGGSNDVVARFLGQKLSEICGQSVIIDNRAGAGGNVGAEFVARSAPDGYTLLLTAPPPLAVNQSLYPHLAFDPATDFAPVALVASVQIVLTVNPQVKAKTVAELVALAKAKPGVLTFGSVGAGSLPHLCGVLFEQKAGIKLVHVPYPGSPESVTDLIAGRITLSFIVGSSIIGQIRAGQLAVLATTGAKRASLLPDAPTMTEAGIPGFDFNLWLGLMAPAGTPQPIVTTLANAARKAMQAPEAVDALHKLGYEPLDVGPEEFAARIRTDVARWTAVARAAGMKS